MKKRLLASLMVLCMVTTMIPAAFALDNTDVPDTPPVEQTVNSNDSTDTTSNEELIQASQSPSGEWGVKFYVSSALPAYFSDFDDAWQAVVVDGKFMLDETTIGTEDSFFQLPDELKFVMSKPQTVTMEELTVNDGVTVNIVVAPFTSGGAARPEDIAHTFNSGITVKSGGSLNFVSDMLGYYPENVTITFGGPIKVEAGGSLTMESVDPTTDSNSTVYQLSEEAEGSLLEVEADATATLTDVKLTSDSDAPVISASGSVTMESGIFSNKVTEVSNTGAAPAIEVKGDGQLTVNADEDSRGQLAISSTGDGQPAIKVEENASLTLPKNPNAKITSENNGGKAVDLAGGAKVQQGGNTITVGKNDGGEAGGSYVDNQGNFILGAGSSVTDPEGNTTELPNGGSVDPDGNVEENTVSVTGVELNKSTLSLDEGDTYTLTATVAPADAANKAVTWTSSNSSVATVDSNGKVTAVSSGTATITVTTVDGGKTATCAVTVSHASSGGGSSDDDDPTYSVTLPKNVKGGEIKPSHRYAEQGDTVTITVDPDKGYELDELTVTDSKGKELDLTDKGNGKYTFKMPGTRVEVEVSFKLIETEPEAPAFADVPASAYYADAVKWAVEQGITSGTSTNTFSPDMSCTRAQIVTFLWRANGSPKADGANPFTDVSADAYYYDAVLWAVKEGITSGTSATTFAPDMTVTRGQTVTFLYRAAGAPAVSGGSFADVAADAYYADAVAWAVKEGITSGTGATTFSPDAACTRGQIVTFMYRGVQ